VSPFGRDRLEPRQNLFVQFRLRAVELVERFQIAPQSVEPETQIFCFVIPAQHDQSRLAGLSDLRAGVSAPVGKVLDDDAFSRAFVVALPAKLCAKFLRPLIDKARDLALFDPIPRTGWPGSDEGVVAQSRRLSQKIAYGPLRSRSSSVGSPPRFM
jgi:hypothetical protein